MSNSSEIPGVNTSHAFFQSNSGTGEEKLIYPNLENDAKKSKEGIPGLLIKIEKSEPGSLDEEYLAGKLATRYLILTAFSAQKEDENRDLWNERFTKASIEIHGQPQEELVKEIVKKEYDEISKLSGDNNISQQSVDSTLDVYESIMKNMRNNKDLNNRSTYSRDINEEKLAIAAYGKIIKEHYQQLFDLVDEENKNEFSPEELHNLFNKALNILKEEDQEWDKWKIVFNDNTYLSTSSSSREIKVGRRHVPISVIEAKKLIAHEWLVHAFRSLNGYKTGDDRLAKGLPGYKRAEEGIAILTEEAISGEFPKRALDRYLDIYLALEINDEFQRTRQDIFKISYNRQLIRLQKEGANEEELRYLPAEVWGHIDRIYKGGLGNNQGKRQAIFTKDSVYYAGYRMMAEYFVSQLKNGRSPEDIFNYLSQGKFDPTNPKHEQRVKEPKTKA